MFFLDRDNFIKKRNKTNYKTEFSVNLLSKDEQKTNLKGVKLVKRTNQVN